MENQEINGQEAEIISEIRQRYSEINFPDIGTIPIWMGTTMEDMQMVPNKMALAGNFGDGWIHYADISQQYQVVKNEVAIKKLEDFISLECPDYGKPVITPKILQDGRKMQAMVEFPECTFTIQDKWRGRDELLTPQVALWNSHDLGKKFSIQFLAKQEVCSNGLVGMRVQQSINRRHVASLDLDSILSEITDGMGSFSEQIGLWESWSEKNLEIAQFETLWEALPFGKRQKEEILELPQTGNGETLQSWIRNGSVNAWALHSVATQYITHEMDSVLRQNTFGDKLEAAFMNQLAA